MPRDGAITFRDIAGRLSVLRVLCDKCGRRGRYHLHRLIERFGIDAKLFDWSDDSRPTSRESTPGISTTGAARGARSSQNWCSLPNFAPNPRTRHDAPVLGAGLTHAPC